MANMISKTERIIYIIIFIVIVLGFGVMFIFTPKTDSNLKNIRDVEEYLERKFENDSFLIGDKKTVKISGGWDSGCSTTGYSWEVTSIKTGVTFYVSDHIYNNFDGKGCETGISDSYESSVYETLTEKENLQFYNSTDSFVVDIKDFISKQELANKVYQLVDKYNLKYRNYYVHLFVNDGGSVVEINPMIINSPEDVINNYLFKKE